MLPFRGQARQLPAGLSWLGKLLPLTAVIILALLFSACSRNELPSEPGDYSLQNNEIRFDGQDYVFRWLGRDSSVHSARTDRVKLVQDDRTLLRLGDDGPVLHLAEDQSVQVEARDNRGNFVAPWYPFLWGGLGGRPVIALPQDTGGNARSPSYRYPPSDSFNRDDTLGGSLPSARAAPPDYTRIPNARDTVGGQSGGTGGGAAVTGRASSPVGGQSGGSGSGSAATDKGGFRTGPSGYSEPGSASGTGLAGKPPSDSSQPRVGAGGAASSGSLNTSPSASGSRTAPSRPSVGAKGIGGARR
jgi:hypothetical protein